MDEQLSIEELKQVAEAVEKSFEDMFHEPMPVFDNHDAGKLSGALAAPFQSAFKKDIYPTVYLKAAALFYFVAKDHAFENGNKRMAVITLFYYLARNNLTVDIYPMDLYKVAVATVETPAEKSQVIRLLGHMIEASAFPVDEWFADRLKGLDNSQ
jgi:prophage maintenance system killer protein